MRGYQDIPCVLLEILGFRNMRIVAHLLRVQRLGWSLPTLKNNCERNAVVSTILTDVVQDTTFDV